MEVVIQKGTVRETIHCLFLYYIYIFTPHAAWILISSAALGLVYLLANDPVYLWFAAWGMIMLVLEFPIMADYMLLDVKGKTLFATHGHLFNEENPPLLKTGDVLLNGHFHSPCNRVMQNGAIYANCGSAALPKEGTPHSYILVEDGVLYWKDLETGGIFDCLTL